MVQANTRSVALIYREHRIRLNQDRLVNLNDMWIAAGSPANKDPRQWIRLPTTADLIEVCAFNVEKSHILRSIRGRAGGTWAIPNLAVAYAKYLSPQFHAWANEVIVERIQEHDDPELGMERARQRAIGTYRRRGQSDQWIQRRLEGIETRVKFTETLQEHGVTQSWDYAACTDAINRPVLGGTAREVKINRGLKPKANLRDSCTKLELSALNFAESLATHEIEELNLNGVGECKPACEESGETVATALAANRRRIGSG